MEQLEDQEDVTEVIQGDNAFNRIELLMSGILNEAIQFIQEDRFVQLEVEPFGSPVDPIVDRAESSGSHGAIGAGRNEDVTMGESLNLTSGGEASEERVFEALGVVKRS